MKKQFHILFTAVMAQTLLRLDTSLLIISRYEKILLFSLFTVLFCLLPFSSTFGQRVNFSTILWTDPLGGANTLKIYDATKGSGSNFFKPTTVATAQSMESVAVDKDGNIAFTTSAINRLGRITGSKVIVAAVTAPNAVTIDNDAEYVYAAYAATVTTGAISRLVWKNNGTVSSFGYYTGSDIGTITSITNTVLMSANSTYVYLDGSATRTQIPIGQIYCGLTFDKLGNLYYTDKTNNVVRRINMKYSTPASTASGVSTLELSSAPDASVSVGDLVSGYGIPQDTYVGSISSTSINLVNNAGTAVNTTSAISSTTGSIVFVTGVQTIIGTGTAGNGTDGIAANTCAISNARGIIFDAVGNLFVLDVSNRKIRKVTATLGIISPTSNITTLGNATTVSTGASGITIDESDNIYIGDVTNLRIYKLSPAGVYSTVAGNGGLTVGNCATTSSSSSIATASSLSKIVPGMLVKVGTSTTGILNGRVLTVSDGSGFTVSPSTGITGASSLTANFASQDGDVTTSTYFDSPTSLAYNPVTKNIIFAEKLLMLIRQLVVKTDLNAAISSANTIKTTATVGSGTGQYSQSVFDAYDAAITTASTVNTSVSSTQLDVNAALANLNNATSTFQAGINSLWTGNGTWNNTGNWSTGTVPTALSNIIISNGTLLIDQNVSISSLTINPGAKLTLSSGNTLSVTANLNINCDATNGSGTFVDMNSTGGLTVAGTTNVQQYLSANRNWYISSPILSATSNVFSAANSTTNKMYYYNEPTGTANPWPQINDNVTSLSVMQGYVVSLPSNNIVNFYGSSLNSGSLTLNNLTRTTGQAKEGFNLVGNPYPSYLNAMTAINANTALEKTIWYKTQSAETTPLYYFETVNTTSGVGTNAAGTGTVTGYIPPMQAFWVRAINNTTLTFNNTMRSHSKTTLETGTVATTLLKAPALPNSMQQLLRLKVSNGTYSDEAVIYFNSNASDNLDDYDSPKITNENTSIPEIYTTVGSENLAINGLNRISEGEVLPIGFNTLSANTFTIKATELSNFDAATRVILRDNLFDIEQDITEGTDYSFNSSVINTISRFSLIFRSAVTTEIEKNATQSVVVYRNANNQIIINRLVYNGQEGNVTICNAIGQKLYNTLTTGTVTVIGTPFTSGVYIVSVQLNGKNITKKLVID